MSARPAAALFVALTRPGVRGGAVGDAEKPHLAALGTAKRHGVVARAAPGEFQVVFSDPARAFQCAVALLRRLEEHNRGCDDPLAKACLRQAVHRGPLELIEDGVEGDCARVLARLLEAVPPGRILATRQACGDCLAEPACEFIPLGWEYFEGLKGPLEVFEVVAAPGALTEAARGR